jgi:hypothetical protein
MRKGISMTHWRNAWPATAVGLVLCLLLAGPVLAADEEEEKWDEQFKGHEMWMNSLPEAIALAMEQDKPILIDIYSRH